MEPCGVPTVEEPLVLPHDLANFYQRAGGGILFSDAPYSFEIVPPCDFVRANPVIRGQEGQGDISYNWFIIAISDSQYITIDLHPDRHGMCYDSFWDRHAIRGDSKIVATSFANLISRLVDSKCEYLYWLMEGFRPLGDAYDGLPEIV